MTKYSVTNRYPAPALRDARQCEGIHILADASKKQSITTIGYAVVHVDSDDVKVLSKGSGKIDESNVTRAEAEAILTAVKLAVSKRQSEHLFIYTDSRCVYRALYSGHPVKSDGQIVELMKLLPSPTEYTIINIHRDENRAHSLARHALKSTHRKSNCSN